MSLFSGKELNLGKEKIKQRNLTLDIEDEVLEEIKSISKKVYEIFHLNGIIRIDFIYTNKKVSLSYLFPFTTIFF